MTSNQPADTANGASTGGGLGVNDPTRRVSFGEGTQQPATAETAANLNRFGPDSPQAMRAREIRETAVAAAADAAATTAAADAANAANDTNHFDGISDADLLKEISDREEKARAQTRADATVDLTVGDSCDKQYIKPPDPKEVLLIHLSPLITSKAQHDNYVSLAQDQAEFQETQERIRQRMKKLTTKGFVPKSLQLRKLTLEFAKEPKDTPAAEKLTEQFNARKEAFQVEMTDLIKQGKEHELKFYQEQNGKLLLESIREIAISSAVPRVLTWMFYNNTSECKCSTTTIGNLAVEQLLIKSEASRQLETLLEIRDLPALYGQLLFDPNDNLDKAVKYDELVPSKGVKGLVDEIVEELEKYIPYCTTFYAANTLRVRLHSRIEGSMNARSHVYQTKQATKATDRALKLSEKDAETANQQATGTKQTPKDQGRQKNSMSQPKPQKGLQHESGKTNGKMRKGNGKAKGNGNANGSKRKQPPQENLQAKSTPANVIEPSICEHSREKKLNGGGRVMDNVSLPPCQLFAPAS
jgi:hypothetical protein